MNLLKNRRHGLAISKIMIFFAIFSLSSVSGGITAGETIRTPQRCKTACLDEGGVFCRPFGVPDSGFCCYTDMGLPCDRRSQMCTSTASDVAKYYSCPFLSNICGEQTIDVNDE